MLAHTPHHGATNATTLVIYSCLLVTALSIVMRRHTFSFNASLNPFGSIDFTSESFEKRAADTNEGVRASDTANRFDNNMFDDSVKKAESQ